MQRAILIVCAFLVFCTSKRIPTDKYKKEVMQTEWAFAKMAKETGIKEAFFAYAADSAVLYRNDKILKGRPAFTKYFSNPIWKNVTLSWQAEFVDVSKSGDLAYTYGSYTFMSKDSAGNVSESSGIFHTVWKKQQNGSWKFVWD